MRVSAIFRLIGTSICLPLALAHAADTYRIVHTYPHDQHAFTQGLVYVDGHLYESTCIKGQSTLREEDLEDIFLHYYRADSAT